MTKQEVVNEIHKHARKIFLRRSVFLKGIDDLWQADLIDMQPYKKYNKGYNYILVVIDCFSKYTWAKPLKTKAKYDVSHAFQHILTESHRIPKHLQTDMGTEFYNDIFQKLMKAYSINHYSTYSSKKASIVERLIKSLKERIFKDFSFNGNYVWWNKTLHHVIESYNHKKHRTTGFKPVDVKKSLEPNIRVNIFKSHGNLATLKRPKFKVGDCVRISKYKNCFEKGYTPNWSTELFTVKKMNNTKPYTYHIEDKRKQPILGTFYE